MIFYTTHAKGGSGASLFATNFAYALAKTTSKKVLFIDANQYSDIANLFGIKAKKTIFNLDLFFQEQDDNLSLKNTKKIFNKTTYQINQLDVLLSPEEYYPQATLNTLYQKTIKSALKIYDYIIIDGEKNNCKLLQHAIPNLQKLFIVTTIDNPSITKTKNFLANVEKQESVTPKISLIYNQTEKFSTKDLENILPFPIACTLPTEINGAWDNILLGVPIIENKKLAYSKKITQLIKTLIRS
jgi:cellulose biosynthesis protein BcsQ